MKVAVLSVGDELLVGEIADANMRWLGANLTAAGLHVVGFAVVGDDVDATVTGIRTLLDSAQAVIVTGGLGPTSDDLTRESLAALAGVPLRRDAGLEAWLRSRYEQAGITMTGESLRMAELPAGTRSVPNPTGSAPGVRLEIDGRLVFAVPGVPSEMRAMVEAEVLPELLVVDGAPQVLLTRVLHTVLTGESVLATRLAPLVPDLTGSATRLPVRIGYLPEVGEVRVKLSLSAADRATAQARLDPLVARAVELLDSAVVGLDEETLPVAIHRSLLRTGTTVAAAESLTGGLVGAELTTVPGASASFRGGIVAYGTDVKSDVVGVDAQLLAAKGAVSAEVAAAMASGVRDRLGASFGVATTGVAGPRGQDGKDVGSVYVAVAGPDGAASPVVAAHRFRGDRTRVRRLTVLAALDLLRRTLAGHDRAGT